MNVIFCLLSVLLSLFLTAPLYAAQAGLSLDEAIIISMGRNKEIKAAAKQEEAARQALYSARGMYYPQINAAGSYTRLNDNINLDINNVRSVIIAANSASALITSGAAAASAVQNALEAKLPQFNMRVQDEDYFNFTLSAVQTLYAGGRINAASAAKKAALASAERNTKAAKEKIKSEITKGYFRLKLAELVSQIRKEAFNGISGHDDKARQMQEQGLISKANRLRASVALAEAMREEKKALRNEELASILLANLLTVEYSSFTLTTDFSIPEMPEPVEMYVKKALSSNSTLNILDNSIAQAEAAFKASRGKILPSLAAFGKYELYKQDLTMLEPNWAAGFMLKVPIFSGFSDYRETREISAKKAALEQLNSNAKEQIKTLVRKLHHDILAAKEEYEALASSEELARENLRLNQLSFEQGAGTSLEVIDAQLALSKVRTERCRALYDYSVAKAELAMVCGE